jgi:hypothetical protein
MKIISIENFLILCSENSTKEQRTSIHHFIRSIDMNLKSELINNSIQVTYQRE